MLSVPRSVMDDSVAILMSREIPSADFEHYKKVLFGCGLRLFEGLQIRVGDFNFDDGNC